MALKADPSQIRYLEDGSIDWLNTKSYHVPDEKLKVPRKYPRLCTGALIKEDLRAQLNEKQFLEWENRRVAKRDAKRQEKRIAQLIDERIQEAGERLASGLVKKLTELVESDEPINGATLNALLSHLRGSPTQRHELDVTRSLAPIVIARKGSETAILEGKAEEITDLD